MQPYNGKVEDRAGDIRIEIRIDGSLEQDRELADRMLRNMKTVASAGTIEYAHGEKLKDRSQLPLRQKLEFRGNTITAEVVFDGWQTPPEMLEEFALGRIFPAMTQTLAYYQGPVVTGIEPQEQLRSLITSQGATLPSRFDLYSTDESGDTGSHRGRETRTR